MPNVCVKPEAPIASIVSSTTTFPPSLVYGKVTTPLRMSSASRTLRAETPPIVPTSTVAIGTPVLVGADDATAFDSTGLAIQDLAVALAALERLGELQDVQQIRL